MPARKVPELSHTVEERFRVTLVYLEALKHLATLVTEIDSPVPGFETRQEFAEWVISMAEATGRQVAIIEASLPVSCLNVDAPLGK